MNENNTPVQELEVIQPDDFVEEAQNKPLVKVTSRCDLQVVANDLKRKNIIHITIDGVRTSRPMVKATPTRISKIEGMLMPVITKIDLSKEATPEQLDDLKVEIVKAVRDTGVNPGFVYHLSNTLVGQAAIAQSYRAREAERLRQEAV